MGKTVSRRNRRMKQMSEVGKKIAFSLVVIAFLLLMPSQGETHTSPCAHTHIGGDGNNICDNAGANCTTADGKAGKCTQITSSGGNCYCKPASSSGGEG